MTLSQKQQHFAYLVSKLITFAYDNGYKLTFGEAYRTPEQAALNSKTGKGIANSLHRIRLAVDLNLFRDGKYLSNSESHLPLGQYWENLDPLCRWGGRFGDGNHYSMEHDGVK